MFGSQLRGQSLEFIMLSRQGQTGKVPQSRDYFQASSLTVQDVHFLSYSDP